MSTFERWCLINEHQLFGASPEIVARFVADIAPMGIDEMLRAVQEVSRMHCAHGLADPTSGGPVQALVNAITRIDPPRSWPKEEKARFLALPYDLQVYLAKRQAIDDEHIHKLQRELADLRKEHHGISQTNKNDGRDAAAAA